MSIPWGLFCGGGWVLENTSRSSETRFLGVNFIWACRGEIGECSAVIGLCVGGVDRSADTFKEGSSSPAISTWGMQNVVSAVY